MLMLNDVAPLRLSDTRNIAPTLCLAIAVLGPLAVLAALIVCPSAATAQAVPVPALAGSSSAPEKDMVTVSPDSPKVTLPSGVTVELVGVGLEEEDLWWSPTGTPISDPTARGPQFHNAQYGWQGDFDRVVAVQLTAKAKIKGSTFGYIVDPTGEFVQNFPTQRVDMRLDDVSLQPGVPSFGRINFSFPGRRHSFTYRFGLATGEWTTAATILPTLHPAPGSVAPYKEGSSGGFTIFLAETPTISYTNIDGRNYSQALLPRGQKLGNEARRIVAVDSKGDPIILDGRGSDRDGNAFVSLPEEDYARVAEFRIQTRPYEWVEFTDIAFNGGRAPGMPNIGPEINMPAVLPQYHRALPGGINIDVVALMQSRADGGQWWRPDGTRLDGPIKELKFMGRMKGYPGREHPVGISIALTSSIDQDISTASQISFDTKKYNQIRRSLYYGTLRAGIPSREGAGTNYQPGAKSFVLRYGVASGPWKTIAKVPMEISKNSVRKRPETTEDKFSGDLMLTIEDQPVFAYSDAQGKLHQQKILGPVRRLGENVARRFVAVMADGSVVPLTVTGFAREDQGIIELAFDRHRGVHVYNRDLDLAQIAEFRLQTRPYAWVTFPNIAIEPRP